MLHLSHAHLCSEHFAECDFVNFMAEYQMGFASKWNLSGCPQGNRPGKNSSSNLQEWSWRTVSDSPEWRSAHMCTWFSASWRRFRYDRKCLFLCIYNPQITISPTSLFSANFNGNRVKNHPKPWTCPLTSDTLTLLRDPTKRASVLSLFRSIQPVTSLSPGFTQVSLSW